MSHFTVGVIAKRREDIDEMLAPYNEDITVAPYVRRTKQQIIDDARKRTNEVVEKYPAMIKELLEIDMPKHDRDIEAFKNLPEDNIEEYQVQLKPIMWYNRTKEIATIEELKADKEDLIKHQEEFKQRTIERHKNMTARLEEEKKNQLLTDEELYKENTYSDEKYDKDGGELSTYNQNSKWDWYQVGGRWLGILLVKDTVEDVEEGSAGLFGGPRREAPIGYKWVDGAKIKDIEFEKMIEISNASKEAKRFWEIIVENKPLNEGEESPFNIYKPEYYIERYGNKENYIELQSAFSTYAMLTEKGWLATGDMGWWGMDNSTEDSEKAYQTAFKEILADKENQDKYLIIVDCHI